MKRSLIAGLAMLAIALVGCTSRTKPNIDEVIVEREGTIERAIADCSSWFFRSNEGQAFELTSLAEEFQVEGLHVRSVLRTRFDRVSICMFGQIADVLTMQRIER